MSELNVKKAFIQQLLTVVDESNTAFENKYFDPTGQKVWQSFYLIPATQESMGKGLLSCDDDRGIFQVSVFCPLDSDTYDYDQLARIAEIKAVFRNGQQLVYNGQNVYVQESTVNGGFEVDGFYKRDISINYSTYVTR